MTGKSADALRNIGEMAEVLGVRTHILRYWEEQFPMLKPLTRAGGRRLYRPEDVALLHTIHRLLHSEGYTIKGARKFLVSGDAKDAPVAAHEPAAARAVDMTALRAVRDRLSAALAAA
ncbi:MerR family transcriptional regulator [Sphingorhabdus sp.]|uniref:MerR family transcriptional regulator n=1 Tax=Sphingorhabdus sp. TaxID=1902408 RepID=UPI0035945B16